MWPERLAANKKATAEGNLLSAAARGKASFSIHLCLRNLSSAHPCKAEDSETCEPVANLRYPAVLELREGAQWGCEHWWQLNQVPKLLVPHRR